MKLSLLSALLLLAACGAQATAQRQQRVTAAQAVLDIASAVVVETHQAYYERCDASYLPADSACVALADALDSARDTILAARRALEAVDAADSRNVGAVLTCSAAAVGRVLKAAEVLRVAPSSPTGAAWAAYVSTLGGTMCDYRDPNAALGGGEAGGG